MAEPAPVIVVTGTGTGVGKTVTTAALVVGFREHGMRLAVVKPVQTGLRAGEPGDLDDVRRLAGDVETREPVRLPDPLAPDTAARLAGVGLSSAADQAADIAALARRGDLDLVLVEGSGGLLVRLDSEGATFADLGSELAALGVRAGYVVVTLAGLGALNHSALTVEALRHRDLDCLGLVIGSWPAPPDEPDLAMRCNLQDLPAVTGAPLLGRIPSGVGRWPGEQFRAQAASWVRVE
jgi:dethiobiotin synthetase